MGDISVPQRAAPLEALSELALLSACCVIVASFLTIQRHILSPEHLGMSLPCVIKNNLIH